MTDDYDSTKLAGTGRHLSASELRTWTRFLDASRLLEEILARDLAENHDMTHSDYEVLVRLDGAGGKMRMTSLAEQVVSSAQKLTHTANRLEKRKWIARLPIEEDGRGLMATLLPNGKARLADAADDHAELIRRFLLNSMSGDEQQAMADIMDRLSTHMRVHRRKESCPDC